MVIWLIGMSASGKTTIGKKLFDILSTSNEKWVFLDGDTFRNIFGEDLGHTLGNRRTNAYRISRFCEFLNSQNVNVLACVLSLFHDNQRYNKNHIANYKEVFIDVSFENLIKRDNKELYKKALNGKLKDVVGVDIAFKPPYSPNMIIDNNLENPNYEQMIQNILNTFSIKIDDDYSYTSKNLLQYPHKYQYSKYEGEKFFVKFKKDRYDSLEFLNKRLIKHNNLQKQTNFINDQFIDNKNIVLKEFLIYLYNCNMDELKRKTSLVNILIKRFEVGKKLYLTYDLKEIKMSSSAYEELLNYPLFSLVLQKYYHQEITQQKLVYLNAILKVNDIISSIKSELILYDEIYYAIEALSKELEILGEYFD